jgi:hypothetical protein
MPGHILIRTLVAALAVSALAAPAAVAQPADTISPQARNAAATAAANRAEDLRRLNAANHIRTTPFAPGYTAGELHGRAAYYSRSHSVSDSTPPAGQRPTAAVSTDDGAPWTLIALGLAGACVLLIATLLARRARLRTQIAA